MTSATNLRGFEPNRDFWTGRPVAVTGATGFLGSHLTSVLAALGARVVVLVRDAVPSSAIRDGWWSRVSVVTGPVEDQALMERMLGEYEVATVFHLAAQTQVGVANRNPVPTYEANVRGTWALLEATRRSSTIRQIVTASSDKAYGAQPVLPYTEDMPLLAINPYDVSKACSDLIAQSFARVHDVPVVVTRCGNFFGPGDMNWERLVPGTIRLLLKGQRPVIRSDGTMTRDYLYVIDGVLAYLQLAEAISADPTLKGEAFNFSSESPLSVLQLVEMLQAAAGTALEPDIRATARHEIPHQYLSAVKARKMLGWKPRHTMAEAIAETVDWYRGVLSFGDAATPRDQASRA
jgi:CDP-glucose 4,6-dehydratase